MCVGECSLIFLLALYWFKPSGCGASDFFRGLFFLFQSLGTVCKQKMEIAPRFLNGCLNSKRLWAKTAGSLWTSEKMLLLWEWLSSGISCPGKLWSLYPWRYTKAVWAWSWATDSRWPCLSRGVWPDDLQRSSFYFKPSFVPDYIIWVNLHKNIFFFFPFRNFCSHKVFFKS